MSNSNSNTSQLLKLKDTCDMCSSSKIRCNKQKPICGRCERLGLQCLYSPARRIGRPNSLRGPQTTRPSKNLLRPRPPLLFEVRDPPIVINKDLVSSGSDIKLPLKPETSSETSQQNNHPFLSRSQGRDSTIAHVVAQGRVIAANDSHGKQEDVSEDLLESAPDLPPSVDDTLDIFLTRSLQPNHGDEVMPMGRQAFDKRNSLKPPSQSLICAATAMKILAHLEMTAKRLESDALVEDYIQIQSYNSIIEIVIASLTPLSTILMCSCSKMLDITLLATSTCFTVLDILHLIIKKLAQYSKLESPARLSIASLESTNRLRENNGEVHCVSSLKDSINLLHSKIMRELPKVANVVSLFSNLCENGSWEYCSSELLLALVVEVKSKFQCLTKGIAD